MKPQDALVHPAPHAFPPKTEPRVSGSRFSWIQENKRDLNEQLIQAAWDNDLALCTKLVAQGANVNYQDREMESCYLIATSEGYLDLLAFCLNSGADFTVYDQYGGNGMIRAAERGHGEACALLAKAGDEVDRINKPRYTALTEAIIFGLGCLRYAQTVLLLLAVGADPAFRLNGKTIATLAEEHGFSALAHTLRRAEVTPVMDEQQAKAYLVECFFVGDAGGAMLALRQYPALARHSLPNADPSPDPALEQQRGLIVWLMEQLKRP